MYRNFRTTLVLLRYQLRDILFSPWYYVLVAVGISSNLLVVHSFVLSIGSSGIDFTLNPIMNFLGGILKNSFGDTLTEILFRNGPFEIAFLVSAVPMTGYLLFSSAFKISSEHAAGFIELVVYGPVSAFMYYLSALLRDLILYGLFFGILALYTFAASRFYNLSWLDSLYWLGIVYLIGSAYFSLGILLSSLLRSAVPALLSCFFIVFFQTVFFVYGFFVTDESLKLAERIRAYFRFFSPLELGAIQLIRYSGSFSRIFHLSLLFAFPAVMVFIMHRLSVRRGVR